MHLLPTWCASPDRFCLQVGQGIPLGACNDASGVALIEGRAGAKVLHEARNPGGEHVALL